MRRVRGVVHGQAARLTASSRADDRPARRSPQWGLVLFTSRLALDLFMEGVLPDEERG